MEIQSSNNLAVLKDELLALSRNVKASQAKFEDLSVKIAHLEDEGIKLASEQKVLHSLLFKTMRARHSKIVEAHTKTFEWILGNSNAEDLPRITYMEWLRSQGGLYWIAGKAGSGKSTLMKYLCDNEKVQSLLEEWAGSKLLFTGTYFFWSAGNGMQKSQEGLLQSLLYDVLRKCPALIPIIAPERWERGGAMPYFESAWTREELFEAFSTLTKQTILPIRLCFFIDGLDEYEGDPVDIVEILKGFAVSVDIKICVSSRPWTELEQALAGDSDRKLMLQDFTRNDIRRYIHDLLEENLKFQPVKDDAASFGDLATEIVDKAQGVFLWVFLVVKSLLRGLRYGDTLSDLQRRLDDIPPDLESYFMNMLGTIEDVYHRQTAEILQMCLAADGALPLMVFSFLDEQHSDYSLRLKIQPWTIEDTINKSIVVQKRVNARCRDLLEVIDIVQKRVAPHANVELKNPDYDHSSAIFVDFLHRTVRDFFRTTKMQKMLSQWIYTSAHDEPFDADLSLCRAVLALIKLAPAFKKGHILSVNKDPDYTIQVDLIEMFLYHAAAFERRSDTSEIALIEAADDAIANRFTDLFRHQTLAALDNTNRRSTLGLLGTKYERGWILIMAVQVGLKNYVIHKLNQEPSLIQGIHSQPLLFAALLLPMDSSYSTEIDPVMLRTLLRRKADPNQYYQGTTVWKYFLRYCFQQVKHTSQDTARIWADAIQLLLEYGANPDEKIVVGNSSEKPTFSGRIIKYPIYNSVSEIIEKCCPRDASRLKEIIERRRGFSILKWIGWQ